jgi:hypothetical protein
MTFYRLKFGHRVVVVYGDACLGFNNEMASLETVREYNDWIFDCKSAKCGRAFSVCKWRDGDNNVA